MDKQKKHTILNVIIAISTIMLILIICSIIYEYVISQRTTNEVNSNNPVTNSVKNENEIEKEQNKEESTTENDEFIGQEEKESETEKEDVQTDDEKALDLAKKEWGNDSSVQFSIEEKKSNKYYIAVKSNATVIAWYEVNTETWEISEFY